MLALLLTLTFAPNLLKDQNLCKKELDKLAFYDELENEYRKLLFNLYYDLHDKYYKEIIHLDQNPCQFDYERINILGQEYPTILTLQRHEIKKGKTLQLSAHVEVYRLPFQIHRYDGEPQHYLIQKLNL